jgi:hypothetical protein
MGFVPASSASLLAFVSILACVVAAFVAAVVKSSGGRREPVLRMMVGLACYLGGLTMLVGTGALATLPMSGLPLFFGLVFIVSVAVGTSRMGGRVAATVPVGALVGFQAFRLPLELVLHAWAAQGTIPTTMTWSGQNLDVISGVVALVAAPMARRSRAAAWVANIIGSVLLLNVVRVAVMSSPVPFGWHVTPPLLLALHLPYALIGPVAVGGAIIGHIVLTRALIGRTRR